MKTRRIFWRGLGSVGRDCIELGLELNGIAQYAMQKAFG